MKLTETQKNFRKSMKNQKSEADPYNYHRNRRKHLGGFKSVTKWNGLTGTVIILVVAIFGYYGFIKTPAPVASINGQAVMSNSAKAYSQSVPARQAGYIKQIESSLHNVDQAMQQVAQFHTQGTYRTDRTNYKNSLLSAMKVCTEEKQRLMKIDSPAAFASMIEAANAYINYTEEALVNWHDNADQPSNSAIERGNYFSNLASQNRDQYRVAFEDYLKKNHYKYTKISTGITYWYQH